MKLEFQQQIPLKSSTESPDLRVEKLQKKRENPGQVKDITPSKRQKKILERKHNGEHRERAYFNSNHR